jgi:zinc D-Ala-D-Ala carboxypeptidase
VARGFADHHSPAVSHKPERCNPMSRKHYAHWREVDEAAFRRRWPNFSPENLACKGTHSLLVNEEALDALQRLRNALGKPINVTSAYRSPAHNATLRGAAPNSQHLEGAAFDVWMNNHDPEAFEKAARAQGFRGFGYYPRSGFMHIDIGPARTWGTPFPKRPADARVFAPEPAPRPVLSTGTGRAAATGIAVAVTTLADNAAALADLAQHPLTAILPWAASALAAVALVALAISILRKRKAEQYEAGEQ